MALDRESIEKRDFPIGRRGYEPDAVDEHLAMLADEVDALRRSASRSTRSESLATAASEQVRLIVDAAERSAADIERQAELEADQIRQDAREAAEAARFEAGNPAREHVERVSSSTATLLELSEGLEQQFNSMLETVRGSATRLTQELQDLQATVGQLLGDATPPAGGVAEPVSGDPASPHIPAYDDGMLPGEPDLFAADAGDEPAEAVAGGAGRDEEGARLIALNMALNGTPREDTERYLADNFELADAEALLDDVYARAGQ
jgi:vacuolar-type H+-ATPase subunit H